MNISTTTRERRTFEEPPSSLLDLTEWAHSVVQSIPEKYREEATIEFEIEDGYNGPENEIVVRYTRPATEQEMEDRRRRAREQEERQRETYEELRKKFGDQT